MKSGKTSVALACMLCTVAAFAGALGEPAWVWTFCDCMNGMTALPNLYALLRLHPGAKKPHGESDV